MGAKIAKVLLSLVQSKKGRNLLKSITIIALSPILLIMIFLISGADGASKHNNHLIDVVFMNHEISPSVPDEYRIFIENYKVTFQQIDDELATLEISDGRLDSTLIKSILFGATIDSDNNQFLTSLNISEYLKCFYIADKPSDESPPVHKAISSTDTVIHNASSYLKIDLESKTEAIYEIYHVALTGINKGLDTYVPMAILLEDAYIISEKTPYIGDDFRSPLEDDWKQYVTSEFGPREPIPLPDGSKTSNYHTGIDFGRPQGTPLLAVGDGKVVAVRYTDEGLGFFCVIDHGGGVFTVYAHMSRIHVTENQVLKQGQQIGEVGSTGYSTGAHLHFEVIVNRQYVNPRLHLK